MATRSIAAIIAFSCAFAMLSAIAQDQKAGKAPAFGNVEIRAGAPNTMPQMRKRFGNGRYELRNATALDLIETAWGIDAENISGGPDFLDLNRYDIAAAAPPTATPETLKLMLQGLLRGRFQLAVRDAIRDRPAYAITAGKKTQLKPAEPTNATDYKYRPTKTAPRGEPQPPVILECRNMTIANFARVLEKTSEASGYLFGYPVLDRTGLKEAWNFDLTWSPRRANLFSPVPDDAVALADALEKQLGLKLTLAKMAEPVLLVEKAVPPHVTDAPRPRMEFEVADIKPPGPDGPETRCGSVNIQPGGRVRISMTLRVLIFEAWGAPFDFSRIIGGSKGMDGTCWQILAKAPVEEHMLGITDPAGWNGAVWNGADLDTVRMMLRSFLEDRFKLSAHLEDRMIDGNALTAAGPKLRPANPSNRPGCKEGPGDDGKDPRLTNPLATRLITCRNMTLTQFASRLSALFPGSPPMADATGISGRFDMTINFSPYGVAQPVSSEVGQPSVPTGAISLFDALKGQLGLKVESRKVTAPVLIVDHVNETPTEN